MTADIPFVPLVALGTLVFTFVNFLKFLSGRDWNAAITQAVAWVAGIVAIVLVAHTDFGNSITIAGHYLDNLNIASQVFLGLMATSLLSTANEFKKAFDHTDSAATPPLIPSMSKTQPVMATLEAPSYLDFPQAQPVARVLDSATGGNLTPDQKSYTISDAEMAAAQRAGWNPKDGDPPYHHAPEPPDAMIPAGTPVIEAPKAVSRAQTKEKPKAPARGRTRKGTR